MAILDTIQLLLAVISGSHTAPVLTISLVHFTIPITTLFTKYSQSEPLCPRHNLQINNDDQPFPSPPTVPIISQHVFELTLVLLLSTVLVLSPAVQIIIYHNYFPTKSIMANCTTWNTMLFVLAQYLGHLPKSTNTVPRQHLHNRSLPPS